MPIFLVTNNIQMDPDPFIRFYYYPDQKTIVYEYKPYSKYFNFNQINKQMDGYFASCDINVPLQNDNEDHNRFVEIWEMDTSSGKKVMTITAGLHLKLNFANPIKKMYLNARL